MKAQSALSDALVLLKRLNSMVGNIENRLPVTESVSGFEPWWFIQERLFWQILVPYARHRVQFQKLLLGELTSSVQISSEVTSVLELIGPERNLDGVQHKRSVGQTAVRTSRSVLKVMGWSGLTIFSLASIVAFKLLQRDTLVYSIDKVSPGLDHDFRVSPIYRELRSRGYRIAEYVHAASLRSALGNIWRRGRLVAVYEALTNFTAWLPVRMPAGPVLKDLMPFGGPDPESMFLRAVLVWALKERIVSARKVRSLRLLLRIHGVRKAVILDDSRHVNELVAACKASGIPVLGYMHGLFNRYHVGLMAYGFSNARNHGFDLYGVWSDYFQKRLFDGDLYAEANTFVSGPLRLPSPAEQMHLAKINPQQGNPIRVLFIQEPRAPQEEISKYIERVLDDARFQVLVRFRDDRAARSSSDAEDALKLSQVAARKGDVYEAIGHADVVVGTYSTALYEAALAWRPVVVLRSSFDYGFDLVRDGLSEYAESPELICERIIQAARLPRIEIARRREVIWGNSPTDGASTALDAAEQKLWARTHV